MTTEAQDYAEASTLALVTGHPVLREMILDLEQLPAGQALAIAAKLHALAYHREVERVTRVTAPTRKP